MGWKRVNEDQRRNKRGKREKGLRPPKRDETLYDKCDGCGAVIEADSLTPTPYGDMCGFCLKP